MADVDKLRLLSSLLDVALDIPVPEREAWLATLSGEAAASAPMLRDLLARAASKETAELLDDGPSFAPPGEAGQAAIFGAGDAVGPYRLLRPIGQGGMGEVWLAERSDGQLRRSVALKLPTLGVRRSVLVQRFARERDILGGLAHPHIARLYDAGLADDGQPYLALELVDGQPITTYCTAHGLDLRQRVQLLLQVMQAVQYAHANLVIHRDLKPSNVLVTVQGNAMLLDFGIAKLLQGDGTPAPETELTHLGGRALTLDYAAPEQVSGTPISIATDVWALGVLLYELLAGKRPFKGHRRELEQAILSQEPTWPPGLPADLSTIVLKALKKLPVDRYATVNALAEDLGRWLRGEPVLAQPDRAWYRARKFVGRHRLQAALVTTAAVALLMGAGVAAWQARVAARERDQALKLLSRNEAVTEFLNLLITEVDSAPGPVTANDLVAVGEALATTAFRHAPVQQAMLLSMLGMHFGRTGDFTKAEALLNRALHAARDADDPSFLARLRCQHAGALHGLGQVEAARAGLTAQAQRTDLDPGTVAECLYHLAYADLAEGTQFHLQAVDHARQALDRLLASARVSPSLEANYRAMLALALRQSGNNAQARQAYAKSLDAYVALGLGSSAEAAGVRHDAALAYAGAGDAKAGLALMDENLAMIAARGHGDPTAFLLVGRASVLRTLGRLEAADEAFGRALAAAERGASPGWQRTCLLAMSELALDSGNIEKAKALLERATALHAAAPTLGRVITTREHLVRSGIAESNGQLQSARESLTLAIADRRPMASTVVALARRAEVGLREDQLGSALGDANDALELANRLGEGLPHSWLTGVASLIKGRVLARMGDSQQARTMYQTALMHLSNTVDATHPARRQVQALLAGAA